MFTSLGRYAGAVLVTALSIGVPAAASTEEEFGDLLERGRTHDALVLAENWVQVEDSQKAKFALGAAQFLFAIERFGNGLYEFGLGNAWPSGLWWDLAELPFLRVPLPPNTDPKPVTYEGLRDILRRFGDDLSVADNTLAGVGAEEFDFALDLGAISLDLDGDGQTGPDEQLITLFSAISQAPTPAAGLKFDFDQSDAPWLRAYTHLLRAMTEFLLAHDWHQAFDETFHFLFPDSDLKSSEIRRSAQKAKLLMDQIKSPTGSQHENDYRQAELLLGYGGVADLIAFIHRFDWPVVDKSRMAASRMHLLTMIDLSRENWRRVLQESDDKYEWLPSPKQTPRFPQMRVDKPIIDAWLSFLQTIEDLLEGRKLIPHWRFSDKGVNVRLMFEQPGTFDPVMIAQGAAVIPYLEEGKMVSFATVSSMFLLVERGFFAHFFWFN